MHHACCRPVQVPKSVFTDYLSCRSLQTAAKLSSSGTLLCLCSASVLPRSSPIKSSTKCCQSCCLHQEVATEQSMSIVTKARSLQALRPLVSFLSREGLVKRQRLEAPELASSGLSATSGQHSIDISTKPPYFLLVACWSRFKRSSPKTTLTRRK